MQSDSAAFRRPLLPLLLATVLLAADSRPTAEASPNQPGHQYALLVGCTRYPGLNLFRQLRGPGNDVVLTRQLLIEQFGFPAENVTVLAENGGDGKPQRETIVSHFEQLVSQVGEGDRVVILLSGHGSQQPDDDPENPDDFEPDGLDEVFCPSDISGLEGNGSGRIAGGIVDDEIRQWLASMTDKGASVWIIVDACHSGTMTRGDGEMVPRGIPPEELLPADQVESARQAAAERRVTYRGAQTSHSDLGKPSTGRGSLVAMYAAQPHEITFERKLPAGSADAQRYGLLSFAVNQILRQSSSPITYRELARQVQDRYLLFGGTVPTPMIEGDALDQPVLASGSVSPHAIHLSATEEGEYVVSAGSLHGFTPGSILAVYEPGRGEEPVGYVRLTDVYTLNSLAEPCEFGQVAAQPELPSGGYCQIAYRDFGDQRLRVAAVASLASQEDDTSLAQVNEALGDLADREHSLITHVPAEQAAWLLEIADGQVLLRPTGESGPEGSQSALATFDLVGQEALADRLAVPLDRLARATNLLAVAARAAQDAGEAGLDLEVELLRYASNRPQESGQPVDWTESGRVLAEGDLLGFAIENHGELAVDVSLLYIDSQFGIYPYFPRPGVAGDNRILPGGRLETPRALAGEGAAAPEFMVVIAVPAAGGGPRADFSLLSQPSLAGVRGDQTALATPLGGILQQALYGQGAVRGMSRADAATTWLQVTSWRVMPPESDAAAP